MGGHRIDQNTLHVCMEFPNASVKIKKKINGTGHLDSSKVVWVLPSQLMC